VIPFQPRARPSLQHPGRSRLSVIANNLTPKLPPPEDGYDQFLRAVVGEGLSSFAFEMTVNTSAS
jgi:hypothetical protein